MTSGLIGEYLRNDTWHRQSVNGDENFKAFSIISQNFMHFRPTLRKFCILPHCQLLSLLKWRSPIACQLNFTNG